MLKKILPLLIVLFSLQSLAQTGTSPISNKLLQLNKPKRILHKYVNFDVLKIMLGPGGTMDNYSKTKMALSLHGQFLWPYSMFRNSWPIAIGAVVGYNRMTRVNASYTFTGDKLTAITGDADVKKAVQKTGYAGLILLKVWRYKSFTYYIGPSLEFNNISNWLKTYSIHGTKKINNRRQINPVSIPINMQISFSNKQFGSFGFFSSYDLKARYRGEFKKTHQLVAGISLGLII